MGMRVCTDKRTIVELEDIPFGGVHYEWLVKTQTAYPNLPLRYRSDGKTLFLPIHTLMLDAFEAVRLLNPR